MPTVAGITQLGKMANTGSHPGRRHQSMMAGVSSSSAGLLSECNKTGSLDHNNARSSSVVKSRGNKAKM